MLQNRITLSCIINLLLCATRLQSQCSEKIGSVRFPVNSSYTIHAKLDHATKRLDASTNLLFINGSTVPIKELRFYMYLNSFKNKKSSFLKGTNEIFGQSFQNRADDEWGWIEIDKILKEQTSTPVDLTSQLKYIQPNDQNTEDQSVLSLPLDKALLPGDTIELNLLWKAKMPKTIARMGYSNDFYLFCHWFPQLGVFEQDKNGSWGWNCHQAFRNTEYYADFSDYDVHLTLDPKFIVGASGCLINKYMNQDGSVSYHYHADKVIDFAWSIDPNFLKIEDIWKHVNIQLLLPKDYSSQIERNLHIIKYALEYFDQHVGLYPYPSITVVCPPFHGLQSGLMEYPTLITTGSFFGMPAEIRFSESLVAHEFSHQYFMAVIATNEKEEPWLDEGFATYFEDRITDAAFGKKSALLNLSGFRMGNRERTRIEYTGMKNPAEGISARPGWDFNQTNYKPLIYSKTATALHTLQNLIGEEKMDLIIKTYFEQWKFKHPKAADFMHLLQNELYKNTDSLLAKQCYTLFYEAVFEAKTIDYSVTSIVNSKTNSNNISAVTVHRAGDWIIPVDIIVSFEDGSQKELNWSGKEVDKQFEFQTNSKIISAHIDPNQKLLVDLNLNNNSLSLQQHNGPIWSYSAKIIMWLQSLLQYFSLIS